MANHAYVMVWLYANTSLFGSRGGAIPLNLFGLNYLVGYFHALSIKAIAFAVKAY